LERKSYGKEKELGLGLARKKKGPEQMREQATNADESEAKKDLQKKKGHLTNEDNLTEGGEKDWGGPIYILIQKGTPVTGKKKDRPPRPEGRPDRETKKPPRRGKKGTMRRTSLKVGCSQGSVARV